MLVGITHGSKPKKLKRKSNGVMTQEPVVEEQPQDKRKVASVLKTFSSKKLTTKPLKMRLKKMIIDLEDEGGTNDDDEEIDIEIVDQFQSSQYSLEANVYDVDRLVIEVTLSTHIPDQNVSPQRVTTLEYNIEDTCSLGIPENTSNMDSHITNV